MSSLFVSEDTLVFLPLVLRSLVFSINSPAFLVLILRSALGLVGSMHLMCLNSTLFQVVKEH